MRLQHHVIISAALGGALYLVTGDAVMCAAAVGTGIFMDLDHLFDYVREHRRRLGLRHFFHACHNGHYRRLILVLHGWEWLILLAAAGLAAGWPPWLTGALAGGTLHLAVDQATNGLKPRTYWFLWRLRHGFDADRCYGNAAATRLARSGTTPPAPSAR